MGGSKSSYPSILSTLGSFPSVLAGEILGKYFYPIDLQSKTQVQNPTHVGTPGMVRASLLELEAPGVAAPAASERVTLLE